MRKKISKQIIQIENKDSFSQNIYNCNNEVLYKY